MSEIVQIRKSDIINAAKGAKVEEVKLLHQLFPEVFKMDEQFIKPGDLFKRSGYPKCIYSVQRTNKNGNTYRILNITHSTYWEKLVTIYLTPSGHITRGDFLSLVSKHQEDEFQIFNYK